MKLIIYALLALGSYCLAAEYSIDPTCDNKDDIKLHDGVVGAIKEGIDLADNAFSVMNDHGSDQYVQQMAKYIIGDKDFQAGFDHAKSTFEAIKAYTREPSQFKPTDDEWTSKRTNVDVEIYCGLDRFVKNPNSKFMVNTAMKRNVWPAEYTKLTDQCYDTDYVLGSGQKRPTVMTLSSDFKDRLGLIQARKTNPSADIKDFTSPTGYACSMDVCTWFTDKANQNGWPIIDDKRLEKVKTDDFKAGLKGNDKPVDGLSTTGTTMLHELAHTNQGGQSIDVDVSEQPDIESCYGWKCVGQIKNILNADSISFLGIAMKVWSLKHYIDDDGTIKPIPQA